MNFQQSKILLEKINSLYKSISMDDGKIAAIERDLMLSYIRQLYDSFLEGSANGQKAATIGYTDQEPEFEVVSRKLGDATPEPAKRKYTPPRIIEIPDSIKEMSSEPDAVSRPKPTPPTPRPEPKPEPVASAPTVAPTLATADIEDSKIRALFEHRAAKELSEKLSEQPVHDLNKAMAINDRLLYTNDLFGKNNSALNQALDLLNKFHNIDEARPILVNLAQQYDWANEEREETARSFIKLVRRRYN